MNLNGIDALGVTVVSELVKYFVKWPMKGPDGDVDGFDIFIKKRQSAADWEFINLPLAGKADASIEQSLMARRVVRLCKLGDDGEQAIPYEVACAWKHDFLLAFCRGINEVQKEDSDEVNGAKN